MPRPRINLEMIDVPVGSILTFKNHEDVTCKVTNQNPPKVCYKGEITGLSRAAQMAGGWNYPVRGPSFWRYEGELLTDRRERLEKLSNETDIGDEAIGRTAPLQCHMESTEKKHDKLSTIEVSRVDMAKDVSVEYPLYLLHVRDDELFGAGWKLLSESFLIEWLESRLASSELELIKQAADSGYTTRYDSESQRFESVPSQKESFFASFTSE